MTQICNVVYSVCVFNRTDDQRKVSKRGENSDRKQVSMGRIVK